LNAKPQRSSGAKKKARWIPDQRAPFGDPDWQGKSGELRIFGKVFLSALSASPRLCALWACSFLRELFYHEGHEEHEVMKEKILFFVLFVVNLGLLHAHG
jgi:hypothetical protein